MSQTDKKQTVSSEEIRQLVIARLRSFPSGKKLSMGSDGEFTKDELIQRVTKDDAVGKKLLLYSFPICVPSKRGSFQTGYDMVITRPDHDVTTLYLTHWSKEIIDQAKKHGVSVVDLRGVGANKKEFAGVIWKTHPSLIVVNGHGNSDMLMGQDNEVLVATGENEQLFTDTIVYARSCESAKNLGPSCITKGTRTYIGYKEDFVFFINEAYMRNPLQDSTARIFLEPSNRIVIALLKGHTAGAAHEKSREMYIRTMQKFLTSETPREERELVPYIHWNMMHQVCLGDGEAKIV